MEMLERASSADYAVGYFESWNLESFGAVIEAAEQERSPVIAGFGEALADSAWLKAGGIAALAGLAREAAGRARVPVSLIFNEISSPELVGEAIDLGFNMIAVDTGGLPLAENLALTKQAVEAARPHGVAVEAPLGELPSADPRFQPAEGPSLTDPEAAQRFVQETGIDALAVSVGNVHLRTAGRTEVDLSLLREIREHVSVPLVLHGGTGLPDDVIPEAVRSGVAKINVGTALKRAFYEGVVSCLDREAEFLALGRRTERDLLAAAREATREVVSRLMRVYGSAGRAG